MKREYLHPHLDNDHKSLKHQYNWPTQQAWKSITHIITKITLEVLENITEKTYEHKASLIEILRAIIEHI